MKTTSQFFKKSILILFLVVSSNILNAQINRQEKSMWCWASCIQSSLYQANVNVSQASIVSRLVGWPQNRPASTVEVMNVLRSYNFKASTVNYPANPQQLYNTLLSGWKVIAFVNPTNNPDVGHFIMLQGIAQNGSIIVSDPTYGSTYQQNIKDLYYGWKWSQSIVVGTP